MERRRHYSPVGGGATRDNFRRENDPRQTQRNNDRNIVCWSCGKIGHRQARCWGDNPHGRHRGRTNAWRPQNRGYRPYQPRYNQNYMRGRNPRSQNYDNGAVQNTTYRNNYPTPEVRGNWDQRSQNYDNGAAQNTTYRHSIPTPDARGNWDQNSSTFNQNPGN